MLAACDAPQASCLTHKRVAMLTAEAEQALRGATMELGLLWPGSTRHLAAAENSDTNMMFEPAWVQSSVIKYQMWMTRRWQTTR